MLVYRLSVSLCFADPSFLQPPEQQPGTQPVVPVVSRCSSCSSPAAGLVLRVRDPPTSHHSDVDLSTEKSPVATGMSWLPTQLRENWVQMHGSCPKRNMRRRTSGHQIFPGN